MSLSQLVSKILCHDLYRHDGCYSAADAVGCGPNDAQRYTLSMEIGA
jgi:hypothetical protein